MSWRDPVRRRLASIRVRVVVGSLFVVAASLGIAILVTWQVLLARLDREIDVALAQEVEELRLLATGLDPETAEPFGTDVAAIFDVFMRRNLPADHEVFYSLVDGEPYLRSFDAPRALLDDESLVGRWQDVRESTWGRATSSLGEVRWLAVPLVAPTPDGVPAPATGAVPPPAGTFVVVFFPEGPRADVLTSVRVVAVTGLVVLLLAGMLAWSLAGQVVRPVRQLTETARSINDADLSGRIPVDGHDEVAVLGTTFNEMVARLDEGFRHQREFLDDVAHELRTPITIAQGHLETLGRSGGGPPPADEVEDTIAIVRDELDRMSRYVSDLLLLAKAERPDFVHPEPVDVGELMSDLAGRVDGLGARRWVLDAAPPPGRVAVLADPVRLEQAMLNLAGNAVEHTADGDEVGIGASVEGGELVLWVRDTGPGVPDGIADTLFQRHARGASERISRREGMGIGLTIVDAVARAHGGRAAVAPNTPTGAVFTITVPIGAVDDDDRSAP